MKIGKYLQIIIFAGILFLFIFLKLPFYLIVFIAGFMLAVLIFKSRIYRKIDNAIRNNFHFPKKFPEWAIKLIVIVIFVLIYFIAKSIIFWMLKILGLDIGKAMIDGINHSIK